MNRNHALNRNFSEQNFEILKPGERNRLAIQRKKNRPRPLMETHQILAMDIFIRLGRAIPPNHSPLYHPTPPQHLPIRPRHLYQARKRQKVDCLGFSPLEDQLGPVIKNTIMIFSIKRQ